MRVGGCLDLSKQKQKLGTHWTEPKAYLKRLQAASFQLYHTPVGDQQLPGQWEEEGNRQNTKHWVGGSETAPSDTTKDPVVLCLRNEQHQLPGLKRM